MLSTQRIFVYLGVETRLLFMEGGCKITYISHSEVVLSTVSSMFHVHDFFSCICCVLAVVYTGGRDLVQRFLISSYSLSLTFCLDALVNLCDKQVLSRHGKMQLNSYSTVGVYILCLTIATVRSLRATSSCLW